MGLPKPYRLKKPLEFQEVYQKGLRRTGFYVILRALNLTANNSEDDPPTQIGISISQKVNKRAVIRNRIKRQIRAVFRELLPRISPGWKIVIVVRANSSPQCEYAQLLRELEQLLLEAEVIINGY
jgi:ribonuclease P protein component